MYCVRSMFSLMRHSVKNKSNVKPTQHVIKGIQNNLLTKFFSQSIEDESDKIVEELCNGDPEAEKKLRILMLEVEVMRQDGRLAPDVMHTRHWKHLLDLTSTNQRVKYLMYLFKTEKSKQNEKAKKEARRIEFAAGIPEVQKEHPDDLIYGISHQSQFLRIRDASMNNFDNYRALQAMLHGQPVVLDCSYEEHMVWLEIINSAKQVTYVFGDNRIHKDPFDLHLCNVQLEGEFMKQLTRNIPSIEEPWFPLNIHKESYMNIFPKEKLVYLTPHCRNELTEFDPDAIYIVGCMVDKVNNEPLSLAKAKRDGLKMAKLPLDRYLEWAPGARKNLNINHMIPILLDMKLVGDWEYALRHIPRRKLMETKILQMQNKLERSPFRKEVLRSYQNLPDVKKMMRFESRQKQRRQMHKKSLYYDNDHVI